MLWGTCIIVAFRAVCRARHRRGLIPSPLALLGRWAGPRCSDGRLCSLVVEAVTGQIIEPLQYGRRTGISAVAVVLATTFWTWLWGPIGVRLAVRLTLCLIVLGRHVAALEFLDILLGDEPALTAEEKFYQRMLAGDSDAAAYQAEDFLKTRTLADYSDEVAVKDGLRNWTSTRGELDYDEAAEHQVVEAVVDDLSRITLLPPASQAGDTDGNPDRAKPHEPLAPEWRRNAVSVCASPAAVRWMERSPRCSRCREQRRRASTPVSCRTPRRIHRQSGGTGNRGHTDRVPVLSRAGRFHRPTRAIWCDGCALAYNARIVVGFWTLSRRRCDRP